MRIIDLRGGLSHPSLEDIELDKELLEELKEGFEIRLKNFGIFAIEQVL